MKKITDSLQQKKQSRNRIATFQNQLIIIFYLVLFSLSASAQVVYTDIVPDYILGTGMGTTEYSIDLNNDGPVDLTIKYRSWGSQYQWYIETSILLNNQTTVLNGIDNYWGDFIQKSYQNDTIGPDSGWGNQNDLLVQFHISSFPPIGGWDTINMGYIALKFQQEDQYFYGWLRLYCLQNNFYYFAVVDYALSSTPNTNIIAGNDIPDGATSLYAKDDHNYMDGRDILVNFTRAIDESKYAEYRIMVAKEGDPSAYDVEFMSQLPSELYYPIVIDTNNSENSLETHLFPNSKDIDGDLILPETNYRVHLLNINKSGIADEHVLSNPSIVFSLMGQLDPVYQISVFDSTNFNNSNDVYVSFYDSHTYQTEGKEYRVIFQNAEDTAVLTEDEVSLLSSDRYSSFPTMHGHQAYFLKENQQDIYGSPILPDTPYFIYVLLLADSNSHYQSALTKADRKFVISNPNYLAPGQKWGENISWFPCDSLFSEYLFWGSFQFAGSQNQTTIDVNRDGLADFSVFGEERDSITTPYTVLQYKIKGLRNNKVLICEHPDHEKWVDVLSENTQFGEEYQFTNENATLLHTCVYFAAMTEIIFNEGHLDYGSIYGQGAYYIGVQINDDDDYPQHAWIKMDGILFTEYGFENIIVLGEQLEPVNQIAVYDSTDFNSSKDVYVSFYDNHSYQTEGKEYRVFFQNAEDTGVITVEGAFSLSPDRYSSFPTESGHQAYFLKENQLDINGESIISDTPYFIYVLLVADSNSNFQSALSKANKKFVISNPNYFVTGQKWGENIIWFPCDSLFSDYLFWGSNRSAAYQNQSNIDVNRDGLADFSVFGEVRDSALTDYTIYQYQISGLRNNKIMICEHQDHHNWVDILSENSQLGDQFLFTNENATLLHACISINSGTDTLFNYGHLSNWDIENGKNYYIGTQINEQDQPQYGWIKLNGNRFVEYGFQNINSGIKNLSKSNSFNVYPNPSYGYVQIQSIEPLISNKSIIISILNNLGCEVDEFNLTQTSNSIDISNYSSGLYFFVIKDQGQILETHKVMVE